MTVYSSDQSSYSPEHSYHFSSSLLVTESRFSFNKKQIEKSIKVLAGNHQNMLKLVKTQILINVSPQGIYSGLDAIQICVNFRSSGCLLIRDRMTIKDNK